MRTIYVIFLTLTAALSVASKLEAEIVYSIDQTYAGSNGRGNIDIDGFFRVTAAGIPSLTQSDILDWSLTFSSPTDQESPVTLSKEGGIIEIMGVASIESTATELIFNVPSVSLGSLQTNSIWFQDTDGDAPNGGNPRSYYLLVSEDIGLGLVAEYQAALYHDGIDGGHISATGTAPFQNSLVFGTVAVPEPLSAVPLVAASVLLLSRRSRGAKL